MDVTIDLPDGIDGEDDMIPRSYQTKMEEIAVEKNTIIHLPTGSGKTYIATRLINRFRDTLRKPWGQGGKRTFFLVNTVPLVNQQKNFIEKRCHVKVAGYSSENGVDYWDKDKWDSELLQFQVIVMTSQILADMITHSYIRIEDINLLIFDECHHAVVDHPMRLVMKHFENCPVGKQPRVLGLTATLLNANVKLSSIQKTLRELETTFHASIATVNELGDVLPYSTNPNETVMTFRSPIPTAAGEEAKKILRELMGLVDCVKLPHPAGNIEIKLKYGEKDITSDPKKIVKEVRNIVSAMIMFIDELGVYGGALGIIAYVILCERLKRKANSTEEEDMYKFVITHSVMARTILLNSMKHDHGYGKIIKHSSEQIVQVLNILKEYSPRVIGSTKAITRINKSRKPLSGIIFTQQRFTSKILYNLLKDVKETNPEEFGFINHDFIVGFNINPYKSTREQHYFKKSSQKALLKFCNKDLNLLISTSVIEEGIDIPQCMLVLRYDPPLEYRSYIQSKGRARSVDSSYVLLIHQGNHDKFMTKYRDFQETERYIQRLLLGNTENRYAPTSNDIRDGLYEDFNIPPYVTKHGARLNAVSAISLLNRYCSVLPTDYFTLISPMWVLEKVEDRRKGVCNLVKIYMPIACPIKDVIVGTPMEKLKDAKRAAALNACKQLHEEGELDEFTLLPRRYGTVDFELPDIRSCFPNWPWDVELTEAEKCLPKEGTKKRIRKHKKVFPSFLQGPKDATATTTYHLHVIKLKAAFAEPNDSRERALYELLQRDEGFGILTPRALPILCDFPMFMTVGEVATSLEINYAVIPLDEPVIDLIKRFHYFIFDQVLEVAKKFTVFDGTKNCMYVVPIKMEIGYDIDWDVMQTHKEIRPVAVPSYEERSSLKVTKECYQHHVVTPWYRGLILPSRYIVSNVLEYMTPLSLFDSTTETYDTYADYYSCKYNLDVVGNKSQPLLEVRDISTRMNCLLPRAATIKHFTDKQRKLISQAQGDDKPKGFPEIFIPEFCIKYDFPGVLWYKAMMLPSIIHRVTMLLVAYELRAEIATQAKYGRAHLMKGEKWLPIEADLQVTMKAMLSNIEESAPIPTIDRINNPIDEESPRAPIVSMKESLYQLQKNNINKEYPWDENMEPIDIERNLSTVTVMDIECYDEFVSTIIKEEPNIKILSPKRIINAPAILPPPSKYMDKLLVLKRKPDERGPELRDVLAALTTIKSHDTFNLERVETLGDSFLKFAASLYLFHKFPTLNEGQLTTIKCRLIGNRNLYYAGAKVQLGGRMKVEQFSPRKDFLVPGFFAPEKVQKFIENHRIRPTFLIGMQVSQKEALTGKLTNESWTAVQRRYAEGGGTAEEEPADGIQNVMQSYIGCQAVADKCVADCVEGIIGTYLLSGGILGAVKILEWFKILPPQDNFAHLLYKRRPTVLTERKSTPEEVDRIMNHARLDVEEILNYKFKDPAFMLEALSHPSYIRNRLTQGYERCEFLGDAILDFLITTHIFENCPDLKPGDLTDLRSALVNNVTFAAYLVKLGLHKFICYQINPALESAIVTFVEHQERRNHEIVEDVLYLINENECQIAEYMEVPKVLSDVFESLIGAIFLDSGGDLQAVWSVVYRIMWKEIQAFSLSIPKQPVRVLYERIHACPSFGTPIRPDPELPKVIIPVSFTKNGRKTTVYGCGGNNKQAKRAGAKLALKILGL